MSKDIIPLDHVKSNRKTEISQDKKRPAGVGSTSEAVPADRVVNEDPEHLYCTTQPEKNQVPGIFMPKITLYFDMSMEVVV